jgi:hypothetical protein
VTVRFLAVARRELAAQLAYLHVAAPTAGANLRVAVQHTLELLDAGGVDGPELVLRDGLACAGGSCRRSPSTTCAMPMACSSFVSGTARGGPSYAGRKTLCAGLAGAPGRRARPAVFANGRASARAAELNPLSQTVVVVLLP